MIMLFLPTSAYSTAGRCQDLFKGSGLSNIWTFPNQIALVKFKIFEEGSDRAAPLESHGLRVEYSYATAPSNLSTYLVLSHHTFLDTISGCSK